MKSTTRPPSTIVMQARHFLSSRSNHESTPGDTNYPLTALAIPLIVVGKGVESTFQVQGDREVDAAHGTLERTIGRGVWVYSDHSCHGSIVNGNQRLHRDAVVVHHGDTLKVGQTIIQLDLETNTATATVPKIEKPVDRAMEKHVRPSQMLSARNVARMARRRASTPWGPAVAVHESIETVESSKQQSLQIETSGLGGHEPSLSNAVEFVRTPLEYSASPISSTHWCSGWNSIGTKTQLEAGNSPSRSFDQYRHQPTVSQASKGVDQASHASSSSSHQMRGTESLEKTSRPPPLEYSSSPTVSPSCLAARQRHNISKQRPPSVTDTTSSYPAGKLPRLDSPDIRPGSRRDDLRIQVSKKMAAAAPASAESIGISRQAQMLNLDFQAPASPVAQRDIMKQQESLQVILYQKFVEEQLLKQQQEEWMRQNMMPATLNDTKQDTDPISKPRIPLSFTTNEEELLNVVSNELKTFTVPASLLARAGHGRPDNPRLAAVSQSSQAGLIGFQERVNGLDMTECCKTAAPVPSPNRSTKLESSSCEKDCTMRSSDESVVSTATTTIACHRRVTSSISSSCASSIGLCDFTGYEDEEETTDTARSYTKTDLYVPAALLRHSRKESTLVFDIGRNSSINSWCESLLSP